MVGGAIPGLVVLGSIRRQAEQAMESKPGSSSPPLLLHQLLPPGPCLESLITIIDRLQFGTVNYSKPFSPQVAFGHDVLSQQYFCN